MRAQEVDLPAIVNVNYMNENAAYQVGTQQATRMVTMSQAVATIDLAVAMTDAKAKQVAYVLLFEGWQERMTITLLTSMKYAYLAPADVISAHGYILRVVKVSFVASGIIQLDCVETLPSIYTASLAGNPTSGWTPSNPPTDQLTNLLILDIPLLQDTDDHTSVYGAVGGTVDDTWRGVDINKSSDAGTTYQSVATTAVASVIGVSDDVLGDFFGGNVFDELNSVTVVIGVGGGELSGVTEIAALSGANEALLGNEIIQYKNVDLISASTYTLSGLLRGRRGTEAFTGTHIIGERFVSGPFVQMPTPTSDLYQPRLYKPVTFGGSLAGTAAQSFTDIGNVYKPYSPGSVGGGADASGNVTINWVPRTRFTGAWIDYVDITLSDPVNFVLQYWDSTYTICARVIPGIMALTGGYTAAQQTTDFGRVQAQVFGTVAQIGSFTLGAQTRFIINAGGAGNDTPITPVQPYVLPPINPPPGPTPSVNGTINWPADSKIIPMTVGQRLVYSFHTGVTIPNTGTIAISEYQSPQNQRHCLIASDAGGLNIIARTQSYGATATSFIGATDGGGILAASTTYYFIFDFLQPDGSLSGAPGANGETILNLGNVT
jgi:hypothetical protein